MGTWREERRKRLEEQVRRETEFEKNFEPVSLYSDHIQKFIDAYTKTGLKFNPDVWYDSETKEASPLTALSISETGTPERFMQFGGRFFSHMSVYHFLYDYYDKNFDWFDGLYNGLFSRERKPINKNGEYEIGYDVGREVRRQLSDYYNWRPKTDYDA